MKQLLLNPPEIASLLLLSVAVSDVLSGQATERGQKCENYLP
jgi:hypothetical protein